MPTGSQETRVVLDREVVILLQQLLRGSGVSRRRVSEAEGAPEAVEGAN